MSRKVCILAPHEVEAWRTSGLTPCCTHHRHLKKAEAMAVTGRGAIHEDHLASAEWVGPNAICFHTSRAWRIVDRRVFPRLVLVEQGFSPRSYRQQLVSHGK